MRIRGATEADVDAVLELWRRGTPVVSHTDDPEGIRMLLARDPDALLVAEEEEDGRLRELGARRVHAGVLLDHEHARAFWIDMGYRRDAEMGRFVKSLGP